MRRWATERWRSMVYGTFCKGIRSDRTCRVSRFFWLRFCRGTADIPEYSSCFRRTARRGRLFSGIIFICGGLKFDICADVYRERRIATDEICPIFPVGVVIFRGFYRVQKFVRDGVRNILVVYDIFVYRNRVFKPLAPFASPFCSNRIVNFRRIRKRKPTVTPARLR